MIKKNILLKLILLLMVTTIVGCSSDSEKCVDAFMRALNYSWWEKYTKAADYATTEVGAWTSCSNK